MTVYQRRGEAVVRSYAYDGLHRQRSTSNVHTSLSQNERGERNQKGMGAGIEIAPMSKRAIARFRAQVVEAARRGDSVTLQALASLQREMGLADDRPAPVVLGFNRANRA